MRLRFPHVSLIISFNSVMQFTNTALSDVCVTKRELNRDQFLINGFIIHIWDGGCFLHLMIYLGRSRTLFFYSLSSLLDLVSLRRYSRMRRT